MDRRQQKTRKAIIEALNTLLQKKAFEQITVQEIIDEANIGRSTFYAHFETKDDLLKDICTDIFDHILHHTLPQEQEHAYVNEMEHLKIQIGHFLYHLKNNKTNIKGILRSESETIFIQFLKEYISDLFKQYENEFKVNVPKDYLLHHLTTSLIETIKWWLLDHESYTPEDIAEYYIKVIS